MINLSPYTLEFTGVFSYADFLVEGADFPDSAIKKNVDNAQNSLPIASLVVE